MKPRKTIKIKDLLTITNHYLANSHPNLVAERKAIASFVSNILHDTGNYNGFNYLLDESNPNTPYTESNFHAGMYGADGRVFFYG